MRDRFIHTLFDMAATNPDIMLLTGDLGFGVLEKFEQAYGLRYINVGVAEQNMIGLATGLALEGKIAVTYSIGNFGTFRCFEQIRNDACYHEANVKIVSVGTGFSYGSLGISHHATEDITVFRALPNITIFSPGDHWEAGECTRAMVRTPGTCYLRLDKSVAPNTAQPGEVFEVGKARILREGTDISLFSTGGILGEVLLAADALRKKNILARVVHFHTLKPLDHTAILEAARQTKGIITVEEHTLDGGFGSAVAECLMDAGVAPKRFCRIGLKDGFSSIVGDQAYLRQTYGICSEAIVDAVCTRDGY
ncbi:MAG: transketolase C-terminal domain-containing protein [Candidatus Margulisiibacteriota bacterium]